MDRIEIQSLFKLWWLRAATPRSSCQSAARFHWKKLGPELGMTEDESRMLLHAWSVVASGGPRQALDACARAIVKRLDLGVEIP